MGLDPSTPRERAATLIHDMRTMGFVFHLDVDGPKVRTTSPDSKLTPDLLAYLRSLRAEVIEVLIDEQYPPAGGGAPPAPAPVATDPAPPRTMVERDHLGQPLVIPPGGGAPVVYRRVTSYIDVLEDREWLERWLQRQVASGLMARPDLLASGVANDALCEAAREAAGANRKRDLGTALHALTERIDRGESPAIPPDFQPDIEAYLAATVGLRMFESEIFVVNDALQVAGTFDRLVEVDGVRYLADIKTGSLHPALVAMQLALYASGERYDNGQRSPLNVDQERGLVISLPSGTGTCSLHWVDLKRGWAGVELAARVWAWRDEPPEWVDEPTPTPTPAPVEPAPAPEPCNTVALAPTPEPEQPQVVLIAGASAWSASKGDAIRARLARLPAGARVAIYGDTEARSKRGLPTGVAAVARIALLGRDVEIVTEDGLDEVLGRVGLLVVFHPDPNGRTATAAVMDRAKTLGVPVEVVTGTRENVEAAR